MTPDARDVLRRERAARLVGIDDDRGRRQRRPRQMMIGDEHVDPAGRGRCDTLHARDAVVDGHDQPRLAPRRDRDDLRGQPVAELEAVGDQEFDVGAHRAQAANADRAGRRAVGVVIGDDQDPLAAGRSRLRADRRPGRRSSATRSRRQRAPASGRVRRRTRCRVRRRSARARRDARPRRSASAPCPGPRDAR